jgi:hypothetical protein
VQSICVDTGVILRVAAVMSPRSNPCYLAGARKAVLLLRPLKVLTQARIIRSGCTPESLKLHRAGSVITT